MDPDPELRKSGRSEIFLVLSFFFSPLFADTVFIFTIYGSLHYHFQDFLQPFPSPFKLLSYPITDAWQCMMLPVTCDFDNLLNLVPYIVGVW